jgi:hypothetical protein
MREREDEKKRKMVKEADGRWVFMSKRQKIYIHKKRILGLVV